MLDKRTDLEAPDRQELLFHGFKKLITKSWDNLGKGMTSERPEKKLRMELDDVGSATAVCTDELSIEPSNPRRRLLLALLLETDRTQLSRLARDVAREENEGQPSTEDVRKIYLDLYHIHVPALSAAGILDYSQSVGRVCITDDRIEQYLRQSSGLDTSES